MCEEGTEEEVGVGVEDTELGPSEAEEEVFSVVESPPTRTTLPVGMRAGGGGCAAVGCALVMFRFVSTSCGSVVLISVIT